MSKVSSEARKIYFERISGFNKKIEEIITREKNIEKMIENDPLGAAYKKLMLADDNLNQVSLYVVMNSLSLTMLDVKNESFLNSARKACYKSLIYLEEVVTPFVDVPFSEYEEKLHEIEALDISKRFFIIRKLGFSIDTVKEAFGEGSKWKWSFVEMEGRMAVISKNLIDLKKLKGGLSPDIEGYEQLVRLLRLTTSMLQNAADRYRHKYEISTQRIDDFRMAISLLGALKRLLRLLGKKNEVEVIKKKIEIWTLKMEKDLSKSDHPSKRNKK